jgi:hypothetical protein
MQVKAGWRAGPPSHEGARTSIFNMIVDPEEMLPGLVDCARAESNSTQ